MAKISWLVNINAFFDKEPHRFCLVPTYSEVQSTLTLGVCGIDILKIYLSKFGRARTFSIKAFSFGDIIFGI